MTRLFKTMVTSMVLVGAILLSAPSIARAACCYSTNATCCGCRCYADATVCNASDCIPKP
jgi:hypothetical protein